jgi:hypothetical protein
MDDDKTNDSLKVPCKFRPEGLDLLVKQLIMKDGFVGLVLPRIMIHDDEIIVTVSMNIGVGSREREYFALEFDIPVHELAKKYDVLNAIELKKEHDTIDAIGKDSPKNVTMVAPGIFVTEKQIKDEAKDEPIALPDDPTP